MPMVHKGSLAHPRVFLAYEEYGEERSRPTDCHFGSTGRSVRAAGTFPLAATASENGHYDNCEAIL